MKYSKLEQISNGRHCLADGRPATQPPPQLLNFKTSSNKREHPLNWCGKLKCVWLWRFCAGLGSTSPAMIHRECHYALSLAPSLIAVQSETSLHFVIVGWFMNWHISVRRDLAWASQLQNTHSINAIRCWATACTHLAGPLSVVIEALSDRHIIRFHLPFPSCLISASVGSNSATDSHYKRMPIPRNE